MPGSLVQRVDFPLPPSGPGRLPAHEIGQVFLLGGIGRPGIEEHADVPFALLQARLGLEKGVFLDADQDGFSLSVLEDEAVSAPVQVVLDPFQEVGKGKHEDQPVNTGILCHIQQMRTKTSFEIRNISKKT